MSNVGGKGGWQTKAKLSDDSARDWAADEIRVVDLAECWVDIEDSAAHLAYAQGLQSGAMHAQIGLRAFLVGKQINAAGFLPARILRPDLPDEAGFLIDGGRQSLQLRAHIVAEGAGVVEVDLQQFGHESVSLGKKNPMGSGPAWFATPGRAPRCASP